MDPSQDSPESATPDDDEEESSYEGSVMGAGQPWEEGWSEGSEDSSDISDWTAEAGISFSGVSQRKKLKRKRKCVFSYVIERVS